MAEDPAAALTPASYQAPVSKSSSPRPTTGDGGSPKPQHSATPAPSEKSKIGSLTSAKVTFPGSRGSQMAPEEEVRNRNENPFKMPKDTDIFLLRDKERQRKKQERIRQRTLHVWDKTTYTTKINSKTTSMIHPSLSDEESFCDADSKALAAKDEEEFTLSVTKDRHVDKETLNEYISKKREMFLVQYSLGVKRDEMRKLEEIAAAEERKLELAEQYLEEDAAMFDEFLKENDKNSVEAIKVADAETKAKLEKVAEIKRINAQMMAVKSDISKYEDMLKEYQLYRKFLESLTPKDWMAEQMAEITERREDKRKARELESSSHKMLVRELATPAGSEKSGGDGRLMKPRRSQGNIMATRMNAKDANQNVSPKPKSPEETTEVAEFEDEDPDEDLPLYFTDPQQLLDIFAELEEQNLSLIQNSQETEEALEEMKQNIKTTKLKMEKETDILKEQIDKLTASIMREEEKAKDLETKAKMFSYGEFKGDDQEQMLVLLNKKVEEVYRTCIGDNEANISTLQMLTNIENRLEDLFEQIELMPHDRVEAAEKAKEKERRLKLREEKIEQQRVYQELRVKKALERAKAEPKKKTGRPLVPRSQPPQLKKNEDDGADQASREEEELAYYFMP